MCASFIKCDLSCLIFSCVFNKSQRAKSYHSDLCGEDGHDANIGGLVKHHRYEPVTFGVPVGGGGALNSGAIILLDDAGDHILEVLAQLGKLLDALLNDLLRPLVNFVSLVHELAATNHGLHCILRNLLNLLGVEVLVVVELGHAILN